MIRVFFKFLSLSDLPVDMDITAYHEFVRPMDYRFSLDLDAEYLVISIIERKGTPWFYVVPAIGEVEIFVVPAALFSFDEAVIPPGMVIRKADAPQPSLEILPASLASVASWFEQYLERDEGVMRIVEKEVERTRKSL
jgi:hypothetical protein